MKNVLNYQSSEYDCGPTSLLNALRYLFERCEIHPELIKAISLYTLDTYNEQGESGRRGTSRTAMQFLASWFNRYGESRRFPISAAYYENERVVVSPNSTITGCLQQGGAAVVRCWLGGDPHYVLLTRALGDEIGLFDPYAVHPDSFPEEELLTRGVRIVRDEPCVMNRIVKMEVLNSQDRINYALGRYPDREAMLLYNQLTRRTESNAVEYMI